MSLKPDLQRAGNCIAMERIGEPLTEAEQAHLHTCARCEAELALWQSFDTDEAAPDEGAAVQWIVSELRRRRTTDERLSAKRGWLSSIGWRPLAGLAAAALVLATGSLVWDREPRLQTPSPERQTYRTSAVSILGPQGDVAAAPLELGWVAVEGAVRYDVEVLEVDGTSLWRATTPTTRLELPQVIIDRIVPGKTLRWSVTAFDRSDRKIAESGMQAFRVTVAQGPGRS